MDSISQIVLGAAVGEAALGKRAGGKAALWGAIGGTIPDLDVLSRYVLNEVDSLEFHRGFSHSILFSILAAPLLGWLINRIHYKLQLGWKPWAWLAFLALFTHPLLDCFTTWGTQLFWPLEYRIAWKTVFVIDPLYTLPFASFLIWALLLPRASEKRRKLNRWGLVVSCSYLLLTVCSKGLAGMRIDGAIHRQDLQVLRYDTRPTPMNTLLWTANIETADGFYITYLSHFQQGQTDFKFLPKNHELLAKYRGDKLLEKLLRITDGYFAVRQMGQSLEIIDLRFGEISGWKEGGGEFVFVYNLAANEDETLVISQKQMGFENASQALLELWERIWREPTI